MSDNANRVEFTREMKKDYTIITPNMAPIHFELIKNVLESFGYHIDLLRTTGREIADEGLKYVHNDTCYPALLSIGQLMHALHSGKYDLHKVALIMTQTGGGCRASNYIHLLRKALVKAGYPQIPVASLNFSGLEKDSGFQMTLPLARRAIASYKEYRDIVMQGDLYRIGTPYDESGCYGVLYVDKSGCYGLMYVSKDRKQAVLFTYSLRYQGRSLIPKFRLDGLDPKTEYTVRELNVDKPRFWFDGKTLSGELLMNAGINPHLSKIYDSAVFILKAK